MTDEDLQTSESAMDLALDVIPSGAESQSFDDPMTGHARPTGRSAVRASRRETAGWELMRDPVYEH